jgi:hypothetical protein
MLAAFPGGVPDIFDSCIGHKIFTSNELLPTKESTFPEKMPALCEK